MSKLLQQLIQATIYFYPVRNLRFVNKSSLIIFYASTQQATFRRLDKK
jgi:hypothetical protein